MESADKLTILISSQYYQNAIPIKINVYCKLKYKIRVIYQKLIKCARKLAG